MSDDSKAIVLAENNFLMPAASIATMMAVYAMKQKFIKEVLVEGTDYGKIPGAGDKAALFKAGAEKMTTFFALAPDFEDVEKVEDWTGDQHGGEPFFFYRQKCKLYQGLRMIASADGSCNSWEKKYRYRSAQRICPKCKKTTIIAGKEEYGGGWLCFAKKGGCGAKFKKGDPEIEGQQLGEVKNPDVAEQVNTILKMAQKRALVAAVLIATNTSDYFTQDIEDMAITGQFTIVEPEAAPAPAPTPAAPRRAEAEIKAEINGPELVESDAKPAPTQTATWPSEIIARLSVEYKINANQVRNILNLSELPKNAPEEMIHQWIVEYRQLRDTGKYTPQEAAATINQDWARAIEVPPDGGQPALV